MQERLNFYTSSKLRSDTIALILTDVAIYCIRTRDLKGVKIGSEDIQHPVINEFQRNAIKVILSKRELVSRSKCKLLGIEKVKLEDGEVCLVVGYGSIIEIDLGRQMEYAIYRLAAKAGVYL